MALADTLDMVSFSAGGYRFAAEARQIDAMLHDAPETMVDVDALLGLPRVDAAHRRCLRVGECIVRVSEPLELLSVPVDRLYPLPEFVALRIQIKGARALVLDGQGAMLLLDLPALLAEREPMLSA